jgi:hypothetical protein
MPSRALLSFLSKPNHAPNGVGKPLLFAFALGAPVPDGPSVFSNRGGKNQQLDHGKFSFPAE